MIDTTGLVNNAGLTVLYPEWPVTRQVRVCTTTRIGGQSSSPYDTLNLGLHVNDKPDDVLANRGRLSELLALPAEPAWLSQNHGVSVCDHGQTKSGEHHDAAWTNQSGCVLTVLTADCLPVVITASDGSEIAVAHAGWRGLADGVLQSTVRRFSTATHNLFAWLGPAIGPQYFEVGDDVRKYFVDRFYGLPKDVLATAFVPGKQPGKWYADLYQLARMALADLGVDQVYGGDYCTYRDKTLFYSYRRDGKNSGRMATMAWLI